ncbi:hypothetical protein [Thalassotalea ganghwensis]
MIFAGFVFGLGLDMLREQDDVKLLQRAQQLLSREDNETKAGD